MDDKFYCRGCNKWHDRSAMSPASRAKKHGDRYCDVGWQKVAERLSRRRRTQSQASYAALAKHIENKEHD